MIYNKYPAVHYTQLTNKKKVTRQHLKCYTNQSNGFHPSVYKSNKNFIKQKKSNRPRLLFFLLLQLPLHSSILIHQSGTVPLAPCLWLVCSIQQVSDFATIQKKEQLLRDCSFFPNPTPSSPSPLMPTMHSRNQVKLNFIIFLIVNIHVSPKSTCEKII